MRKVCTIAFSIVLAAVFLYGVVRVTGSISPHSKRTVQISGGQPMLPTKTITIGKNSILAELATTGKQKNDGLSGRTSLEEGTGMLFEFGTPSIEGFWMKDMRFSLDIIWADNSGTIVTIFQNLSPTTYPNVFKPTTPARYVLELPAGYTAVHGIAVGDKIVL